MARSKVPQFGNWESEENVQYTAYFEKAGKGKKGSKMNPNDPQEYSDAEKKVLKGQDVTNPKHSRNTSREDNESRRSAGSPLHSDTASQKSATGSHHQRQGGGVRYAGYRPESEAHRGSDMHRPRHDRQHDRQVSREEGDMRRPVDSYLRNENANQKSAQDSPYHRHGGISGGETPKRVGRHSVGPDRSIEHSPLHPHFQARAGGKGSATSSPSWERKGLSEGGHGLSPSSTPGRSRLRSVTKGDDTSDQNPAVPKFGDWDEKDPTSGEGYTGIFSKVREEKQSDAGKVATMPNEAHYANGQKRIATTSSKSKGCGCFPWSR